MARISTSHHVDSLIRSPRCNREGDAPDASAVLGDAAHGSVAVVNCAGATGVGRKRQSKWGAVQIFDYRKARAAEKVTLIAFADLGKPCDENLRRGYRRSGVRC